jgi:hypothetical protein
MRLMAQPCGEVWISAPDAGCAFVRALGGWHSADLRIHLQRFTIEAASRIFKNASLIDVTLRTEPENSLPSSLSRPLRERAFVPRRVTRALFGSALRKDRWLGRWIDATGNGEAILMSGRAT